MNEKLFLRIDGYIKFSPNDPSGKNEKDYVIVGCEQTLKNIRCKLIEFKLGLNKKEDE